MRKSNKNICAQTQAEHNAWFNGKNYRLRRIESEFSHNNTESKWFTDQFEILHFYIAANGDNLIELSPMQSMSFVASICYDICFRHMLICVRAFAARFLFHFVQFFIRHSRLNNCWVSEKKIVSTRFIWKYSRSNGLMDSQRAFVFPLWQTLRWT